MIVYIDGVLFSSKEGIEMDSVRDGDKSNVQIHWMDTSVGLVTVGLVFWSTTELHLIGMIVICFVSLFVYGAFTVAQKNEGITMAFMISVVFSVGLSLLVWLVYFISDTQANTHEEAFKVLCIMLVSILISCLIHKKRSLAQARS